MIALDRALAGQELLDRDREALRRAVTCVQTARRVSEGSLLMITEDDDFALSLCMRSDVRISYLEMVWQRALDGQAISLDEFELAARPLSELSGQMLTRSNDTRW